MVEDYEPSETAGERDLPQPQDVPDDDETEMVRCPHCSQLIYEETVKCPHCESWIIDMPQNEAMRSRWFWPIIIAIGVVMILVTLVARVMR